MALRLTEAAETLAGHLNRIGAVIGALHASGHSHRKTPAECPRERSTGRDRTKAATRQAIAELFEPERSQLRLLIDTLTDILIRLLSSGRSMRNQDHDPTIADIADVFLHCALIHPAA